MEKTVKTVFNLRWFEITPLKRGVNESLRTMIIPRSGWFLISVIVALLVCSSFAAAVKDREGAVRDDRAAMEKDARWLYNDFQKGFAEAKRTGKPVLVVLRCVPCLACSGIDAQVLLQDSDLAPLLDQFVCVRVINANTLDLSMLQFDYDLSFSTLFFNGDGTVYGRYGSWAHQKNAQDKTTAGYKRALEAALVLHRGYPANKASLAGKQGVAMPFKTPLDIPGLAGRYKVELDWKGKVVPSCVHCHQVGEAFRAYYREQKTTIPPSFIYPWPAPETLGLTLAPDQIARVQSVTPDSVASKAGLQAGDELVTLDGQPLISIADVSWALDHAPEAGTLAVGLQRGEAKKKLELILPPEWRTKTDISKRVGTWSMRGMATGGLVLEDLPDDERSRHGLGNEKMGLLVKFVGQYGKHAAAKNAGFQKDDLIVDLGGASGRVTEGELIGRILNKYRPGEKVKTTVVRNGQSVTLSLPIQ